MNRPILLLLTTMVLSACGGGSSNSNDSSTGNSGNPPAPTNPTPTDPTVDTPRIVDFNYAQQANHQVYRRGAVQSANFMNASGQFKLPINEQSLTGNITISIDISDPDTLTGVYVGFTGTTRALELCTSNCGQAYSRTLTGINPLDFDVTSGDQRLELWVNDAQGNRVVVSTVDFEWHVTPITGINASRNANTIDLQWNGINNYLRYNVYMATEAGVTPDNYQSLADGRAFYSLKDPNIVLTGTEDTRTFYTTVTGVNGSGESAFGQLLQVAAVAGAVDTPPNALDDSFSVDEEQTLTGSVTTNDSDLESVNVTVLTTPVTAPSNGSLTLNADGSFTYTPRANFSGRDAFVYEVRDGVGQSDTATALIDVNQANDAPVASINHYNVLSDEGRGKQSKESFVNGILEIDAPGLLINDIDIDSGAISVVTEPLVAPTQGQLTLNADGSFRYVINPGASGEDSFTYQTIDNSGSTTSAVVRITIDGVSFPPFAVKDEYQLAEDESFAANNSGEGLMGVLNNDSDLDVGDQLSVSGISTEVQNGTLNVAADGSFSYIPDLGFYGVDYFVYDVTDSQGNFAQAAVILNVAKKNNAPLAIADNYSLLEDTSLTVSATDGVLNNDSDQDFDSLSVSLLANANNGQVTIAANGSFDYTPNQDFFGTDTFTYTVTDGESNATGTVSLVVTNENDPPVANEDFAQTSNSSEIVIDVLENDTDIEGNTLTVTVASIPNNQGSAIINSDSTLTYIPRASFEGTALIDYTIDDGFGGTAQSTVTISVNIANNDPVAVNDSYTIDEDQTLNANGNFAPTLLDNDSDPDGENLVVLTAPVSDVSNGSLTLSGNGSFRYTPNDNFFGSDSFTYRVRDTRGGLATATATITVNSVNDVPVANNDQVTTAEETLINIDVLANDQDADNDSLTVVSASANFGSVVVASDNSLNYTPNVNVVGSDEISYTIADGNQGSDTATVAVTIVNVNDNPIAVDDNATTSKNAAVTINVLANDSDVDGDSLSVVSAQADNGSVVINANNQLTYTPNNNFSGFDNLTYVVGDGNGGTDTGNVTIEVINTNTGPVANNDSASTDEDVSVTVDVLANDTDSDDDTLSIVSASAQNGAVSISGSELIYTPNLNFFGEDQISYTISDGLAEDSAVVNVTVNSVNDAPIANDDALTMTQNSAVQIEPLTNDSDVENHALSIVSANATFGVASVLNSTTIIYQSIGDFSGQDTISYTIEDELGASASATIFVQVSLGQQPPVAVNDSASTSKNTAVVINVLANDSDPNNDTLIVTAVAANSGEVSVNSDQTLTYTPSFNFVGSDVINYTISDGNGNSASAIVDVTVFEDNQQPVAVNDSVTTSQETSVFVNVLANDSDPDGDALTITTATASNGSVVINSNQTLTYQPNSGFSGSDVINYSITDGRGGNASAMVSVTVTALNQPPVAVNDSATTEQNTAVIINVLANDSDPENDTLTVTQATAVNGSVTVNADQSLNYQPNTDFVGADTVNYRISDGNGNHANGIVNVTVVAASGNTPPVAVNDVASVVKGNSVRIDVLANDSDVDGDSLTITEAKATNGIVTINDGLSLLYQANVEFIGQDTVEYTITDGNGNFASAIVNVTVTELNNPPVANNDEATTQVNVAIDINVLSNDSDADGDSLTIVRVSPNVGAVTVNPDSTIKYQPQTDFVGTDVFGYTIDDGKGSTASAQVSVKVEAINQPPTATDDIASTNRNVTIRVDVLANDVDPEGDTLTITAATATTGEVSIVENQLEYVPQRGFVGEDKIEYTISDGNDNQASAVVTMTVVGSNQLPVANDDVAQTDEEQLVVIDVLANDSDADGDTLTIATATAQNGVVDVIDNKLHYTGNLNFSGVDTISYTIVDGFDGSATGSVEVTVNPINDAPIAVSDVANLDEDTSIVLQVLANDSDPDGDNLTITTATADNGTVIINQDQSLSYQGNQDFFGQDIINYTITDGGVDDNEQPITAQATVTVTVNPVNDPPIAVTDNASTTEDVALNVNVLVNDTDVDQDVLTISIANAQNGSVVIESDQTLTYTPNQNFNGNDVIEYQISDGQFTAFGIVNVTVAAVNDLPVANVDSITMDEDGIANIDVLANDTDLDNDVLIITGASAQNGSVQILQTNQLQYVPSSNFNGTDTIDYQISDGNGGTAGSTVAITIVAINDQPVANNDTVTLEEDSSALINVLANDVDVDGDSLAVTISQVSSGGASVTSENNILYLPNPDFNGSASIVYAVDDGNGGSNSAVVNITVVAVNDLPVAVSDSATTNEDTAVTVNVLSNDSDSDGDNLTLSVLTASNGGAFVESTGSELTFVPTANFNGQAEVGYQISDGNGGVATASLFVTVLAVNDQPVANNDSATVDEDSTTQISVLTNDTDVDGDQLFVISASATNGAVNISNNSILEYQPNLNFFGRDTITYVITDSQGGSADAQVDITVSAVNDAPEAIADHFTIDEDQASSFNVLANDSDVENSTLNIVTASATSGEVTIGTTDGVNVLNYLPANNFNGEVSINYTISDNSCTSTTSCSQDHYSSTSVSVFVNAVNDAPVMSNATATIAENVAVGHLVYTVLATDVEQDALTYAIVSGNSDGVFGLNQTSGELTVVDKTHLDFDKTPQYILSLTASDSNGGQGTAQLTIDVTKVTSSETLTADSSFGNTSITGVSASNAFAFDNYDVPYASVMDSLGRITMAGSVVNTTTDFAITRYLADGTTDLSFGVQGVMIIDLQGFETIRAMAVDSADNLYLVGDTFLGSSSELVIARISASGQLDSQFGTNGLVSTSLNQTNLQVADVLAHSDGSLVVGLTIDNQFSLRRYNAQSGSFMESVSFDVNGDFEVLTALAEQSDGQIVVVGHSADSANNFNYNYIVVRVNNSGFTLDTSFGSGGQKQFDLGSQQDDFAHDVLVAPNGDIAIVGATAFSAGIYDVALAQLDSTGVLNTNIDNDGIMIIDADGDGGNQSNSSMAMNLVLHNNDLYVGVQTGLSAQNQDVGVVKIGSGGVLDTSFGTNGIAIVDVKSSQNYLAAVMVDSSNRPMLAATVQGTRNQDFALARMTTTGLLDSSFVIDGYNNNNFTASEDELNHVIELTQGNHSGKFVAVGQTQSDVSVTDALVARYTTAGILDTSFGNDGYVKLSDNSAAAYIAHSIKELTDGRLVVAGQFGDGAFVLMLTTDGKLDTSFATTGIKTFNAISNNLQLEIKDLAISNNHIVFAGHARDITNDSYDIYLGRVDLTGNFDSSYGSSGEVLSHLGGNEMVNQMAITSDGSVIIVGSQISNDNSDSRALLAKYTSSGGLDTATNNGFYSLDLDTTVADNQDQLFDVAVDSNGNIYASGRSQSTTTNQQAMVSIDSNGQLNSSFGSNGIALYDFGRSSDSPTLTLDSSQKPVLAGLASNTTDGGTDVFIIRLSTDGSHDPLFNNGNPYITSYSQSDEVSGIVATSTGKIMIAGQNEISGYSGKVWYLQMFNLVQQ